MPTGMRVASPKFSKSDRKPKKTKHCTIPIPRKKNKKKTKRVPEKGICPNKMQVTNQNAIKKMYETKNEENLHYRKEKDES